MCSVVRLSNHARATFAERIAGLPVLGPGRRVLLAPAPATTGSPTARGTELVRTRCTACLPGVVAYRVTQFSGRFLNSFSKAFRSGEL